MSATTVGAGLDLATSLLQVLAPTISQEQKESLLNAYKQRIANLQAFSDEVAKNPASLDAGRAYGAFVGQVLNAGGLTAGGLAAITIATPLDTSNQLVTIAILYVLLNEQTAVSSAPIAAK